VNIFRNDTICAACSRGAATICPRPLQVVTEPTITRFSCKEILIVNTTNFNLVPVLNFPVVTNVVFHLRDKKTLQLRKTPFIYDADCLHILCDTLQSSIINVIVVGDGNHFYYYPRLLCRVMACFHYASNWRRHVITLTFDLWGHRECRSCGSWYSILMPSLKSSHSEDVAHFPSQN